MLLEPDVAAVFGIIVQEVEKKVVKPKRTTKKKASKKKIKPSTPVDNELS
jgi:hypothetical protein